MLFEQLTDFDRYKYKAYAFSQKNDKIRECNFEFLTAMAAKSHVIAQTNLGHCYQNGDSVPKDCVEAVRLYRLAAAQGSAMAKTILENFH